MRNPVWPADAEFSASKRTPTADEVIAILTPPLQLPRLVEAAEALFRRWTALAMREYPSLSMPIRETAFAVAFDQLAREAERETLVAESFWRYADKRALAALSRHQQRAMRSSGRSFTDRDQRWVPAAIEDHQAMPHTLIDALRTALERPTSVEATHIVHAFEKTWAQRAARSFSDLPAPARQDAVQIALARLTSPVTIAGLTPANLSARARYIAVQALSSMGKRYQNAKGREVLADGMLEKLANHDVDPSRMYESEGATRAKRHILDRVLTEEPWLRDGIIDGKPAEDIGKSIGKSPEWVRQNTSRTGRAIKDTWVDIDRGTLTPEATRRVLRSYRVLSGIRVHLLRAVDEVLDSGVLKALIPAVWLSKLERMRERLRRHPVGGDDRDRSGPG